MKTIQEFVKDHDEWKGFPDLLAAPPSSGEIKDKWPDAGVEILQRCEEGMNNFVTRGAQYWLMRQNGSSDSFASMVSLQAGPVLSTDDTFFQGSKPLYDQFGSQKHLDKYLKVAKRRGFTPPVNSTYFPGLARFQGDPEAFVSRAQGRSYIKKLCEKRGWACDGAVNVEHREPERDPLDSGPALADDIIRDRAMQMAKTDPKIKNMNRNELREKIIAKHGPSK